MSSIKFAYRHFVVASEDLEAVLNEHGEDGWRLHTCEPVASAGDDGEAKLFMAVVMDKATQIVEVHEEEDEKPKAIRCRG